MAKLEFPFIDGVLEFDVTDPPFRVYHDTRKEVVWKLIRGVEYLHIGAVDGHIAEFGTASGLTASALCYALGESEKIYRQVDQWHGIGVRNVYLFDSFEGLPEIRSDVDKASPHVVAGVWGKGGCYVLDAPSLRSVCEQYLPADRIRIFSGWFEDTLPTLDPEVRFGLVHLDCDLYESTLQALDFLLANGRLSDGCALFFDDWNSNRASPRLGQRRAWRECVEKYGLVYDDGGEYAGTSRKFILHLENDPRVPVKNARV
ncbi:MAG: TylF/MycF/NovP-related O-methyltransferase [Thermodesulfobacteriota bacterium]